MDSDRLKILLIEDNADYVRLVQEYVEIESPGRFEVESAPRLSTGIELLLRGGIDLVLLDLNLPDSHGLDTYVTVRTQAPDVATVVLTGVDDEKLAMAAARQGAQDYLVKGQVRGDGLVRCIHYAYERQQGLVQLRQYARLLVASEERARQIIEGNADAIVIADTDGRVLFVNRSAEVMFGKDTDALVDRTFEHSLVEGQTTEIQVEGPPPQVVEMRVVASTWDDRPVLMALLRDVTERRRAADLRARLEAEASAVEELQRLDRMKSEFMRNVTDELVTPLSPLQTAVDDLLDGPLSQRQQEVLRLMSGHIRDLARFAGGVQTLTRLDSGRYDMQMQDTELTALIEVEVEQLRTLAEPRRLDTSSDLAEGTLVRVDRGAVRRVIRHLVENALTHNPDGTDIVVRSRPVEGGLVEVAVMDSGRGIPADHRDRVFDAFYQTTPDGSTLGAGIGLALCKALVEKMGGTIAVESHPGEGAEVRFTLREASTRVR